MPRRPNEVPVYSRHKAQNLAVTTVRLPNGKRKDIYLGPLEIKIPLGYVKLLFGSTPIQDFRPRRTDGPRAPR